MTAFLLVVQRYLIRLLQRIRRCCRPSTRAGRCRPSRPPMAEIRAVEDAIVRFHATLLENDEVRGAWSAWPPPTGSPACSTGTISWRWPPTRWRGRPATAGRSPSASPTLDHFKRNRNDTRPPLRATMC